jgi:hypothetical protein
MFLDQIVDGGLNVIYKAVYLEASGASYRI